MFKAKLSRGSAGIDVAVKTIKRYESESERTAFLHEQAIMSQLAHPNVVRLYGLVQQGMSMNMYYHKTHAITFYLHCGCRITLDCAGVSS